MRLIHWDCLIESDKIESGSVDLILTDLPYGTVKDLYKNTSWDVIIDIDRIMLIANRVLRKDGKMILFAQEPFSTKLITKALQNIPFSQRLIWEKDSSGNMLFAKKACVNFHEDVLIFTKNYEKGKDKIPINPIYEYLKEEKLKSNLSTTDFNFLYCDYANKTKNRHRSLVARYWETSQFLVPKEDIYKNVLQSTGFFKMDYKELIKLDTYKGSTFNLWEGKKYKSNILKYKKDYDGHHPTQKPLLLLEDLIKTFSNENDLVVDLTMGSGSTGVAAKNTNRNFIWIEQDEGYFNIAKERIKKYV